MANVTHVQQVIAEANVILICPLHWGLGHASRCVPLVRLALSQGKEVVLASDGAALALLQQYFPQLTTVVLPSYGVRYPFNHMLLNAIAGSPKALSAKAKEYRVLQDLVKKYNIDLIISDNRFGCYHQTVRCVFLTHQLHLMVRPTWLGPLFRWFNYHWISRFDEVWVPDDRNRTLSGKLSDPSTLEGKLPVHFIGHLSAMPPPTHPPIIYDYAIILSGPEPQRTLLGQRLMAHYGKATHLRIAFVHGDDSYISAGHTHIKEYGRLHGAALAYLFESAAVIICRSGYSTIMDLVHFGKKAILIPTPGQTEQEYLARHLEGEQFSMFR